MSSRIMTEKRAIELMDNVPVHMDWVKFKGEHCVVDYNVQATMKAGKPMVNIYYCMTKALNSIVDQTVQWDKKKFQPSHLSNTKW